ncbi:unnamed protein product [Linum trigynum]|uniref:Uncharacterized protein n=1 Tax=Linum trigynum TaxID=586398 RepID=A0AAV2E4V3_9ROSI
MLNNDEKWNIASLNRVTKKGVFYAPSITVCTNMFGFILLIRFGTAFLREFESIYSSRWFFSRKSEFTTSTSPASILKS